MTCKVTFITANLVLSIIAYLLRLMYNLIDEQLQEDISNQYLQ